MQKHKRSEDSMAVRSAREAAYETIRSRIITMELKPGDELNDHELAQELGISRMSPSNPPYSSPSVSLSPAVWFR